MSEVVVIPEAQTDDDASVAFAAGVATAEAAQASQEAAEASVVAEEAATVAEAALEAAHAATTERWAERDALESLASQVAELRGMVADAVLAVDQGVQQESEMTPERIEREAVDVDQEEKHESKSADKPKSEKRKYGNSAWFG